MVNFMTNHHSVANMEGMNLTQIVLDNEVRMEALEHNTDTFFVVFVTIIISFMQCGFAFLEAGSVRSKNTTNILLKNLLDTFIGCFVYWAIGYPIASGNGNSIVGYSGWFGTFPEEERINWLFQFVFAATACTIVSGSVAERCNILPYFVYSVVITGIVYPAVSRWGWHKDGWLSVEGRVIEGVSFLDFAGSGVVHLTGAGIALWGAYFSGPRIGRYGPHGIENLPGHSVPLAALGAFILLFGFMAFNGGSRFSISQPGDGIAIATAIFNTIVSGTGGAGATLAVSKLVGVIQECKYKDLVKSRWSILKTINGALVGMVAICAGCDVMSSRSALITGIISSFFYMAISILLLKLKIDDPLDAVAVHGGGGLWGILSAPIFTNLSKPEKMAPQFVINLIAAVTIMAWTSVWGVLIFGIMSKLKILRITADIERIGMDQEKHGEPAYPKSAWLETWDMSPDSGSVEMTVSSRSFNKLINSIFCNSVLSEISSTLGSPEHSAHKGKRQSVTIVLNDTDMDTELPSQPVNDEITQHRPPAINSITICESVSIESETQRT